MQSRELGDGAEADFWPVKFVFQPTGPFNNYFAHVNMTSVRLTTAGNILKQSNSRRTSRPCAARSMRAANTQLCGDKGRNSVACFFNQK